MKDKEKQIEEMGKVMPEKIKDPLDNSRYIIFGKSLRREIARIYYNAGYRKLPEGSVVLSREEYEKVDKEIINKSTYDAIWKAGYNAYEKTIGECVAEARKETAEKIYLQAKAIVDATKHIVQGREYLHLDALKEIIKSCGVEIKELDEYEKPENS